MQQDLIKVWTELVFSQGPSSTTCAEQGSGRHLLPGDPGQGVGRQDSKATQWWDSGQCRPHSDPTGGSGA